MKAIILVCISLLCAGAFAAQNRVEVIANVEDVEFSADITPKKPAIAVLKGEYPDGCYQWQEARVEHESTFIHNVTAVATTEPELLCTQALVPFEEAIYLGHLAKGTHTLRIINSDGEFSEYFVESRTD